MRYVLPRIGDVFFLSIFAGALLLAPRMLNIDSDLGRHLTLGNYILNQHKIPLTDILSHTKSGESRPPYEWLSQFLFALAYRLLGLDGVALLVSLVLAIAFTFVYADAIRRSGLPILALMIAILSTGASSVHWLPRPHIFTFFMLAIWLESLERLRMGKRIPLWQFPVIMLVWANLHGGFVFGFLAWVAYLAGLIIERFLKNASATAEIKKNLIVVGPMSLAASIVTPSGWGNWRGVLSNSSIYILNRTIETMSPGFHQKGFWPYFLLVLLCIAVPLLSKNRPATSHIFLLMGFSALGFVMARNIPLFALTATPILAMESRKLLDHSQSWLKIEMRIIEIERTICGRIWPVVGALAIMFLFSVHFARTKETLSHFNASLFPVSAADWLSENPQSGNMFNEFNWGGYLLFRLWPGQRVFLDSQTDFYGEELVRAYEEILSARGDWEEALAKYDVGWAIIRPTSDLGLTLRKEENWEILYEDNVAVIFKKVK
jgi:hypothetical protein